MATVDQQAELTALDVTIATQKRQIDLAATQVLEGGKMMRFDLDKLQEAYNANVARRAFLAGTPQQVRRLLPVQYGKGL